MLCCIAICFHTSWRLALCFSSCPEHPPTKVGYRADMCQLRVFNKPTLGAAVWQEGHWAADCPAQGSGGQYGGQGAGSGYQSGGGGGYKAPGTYANPGMTSPPKAGGPAGSGACFKCGQVYRKRALSVSACRLARRTPTRHCAAVCISAASTSAITRCSSKHAIGMVVSAA